MKHYVFTIAVILFSSLSHAQIYQWKDDHGATNMSDKPPVGKVQRILKQENRVIPSDGAASNTATNSATNAAPKKTLADQDLAFRKRLRETQERSEKAKADAALSAQSQKNCEILKMQLLGLENGDRVQVRSEQGERAYLEDGAPREQEIARTRQAVKSQCK